jgi:hypothetical protein
MPNVLRALFNFLFLFGVVTFSLSQSAHEPRPGDDSDWWSIIRENSSDEKLRPQAMNVAASNFRILGITLGADDLTAIQDKLGPAVVTGRGNASTSRLQICYAGTDHKTYLAFESDEVQYGFYLFSIGPKWSGSDQCATSNLVNHRLKTASGLRLGLSRAEVHRILGQPTASLKNGNLVYFRQVSKKTSAAHLKKLREYYSNLSDEKFHRNYDLYDMTVVIRAQFSGRRLVYLGISKSDTY